MNHVDKFVLKLSKEELEVYRKRILKHSKIIKTKFGDICFLCYHYLNNYPEMAIDLNLDTEPGIIFPIINNEDVEVTLSELSMEEIIKSFMVDEVSVKIEKNA